MNKVLLIKELLEKFLGITNAPDSLRWKHSKDETFTEFVEKGMENLSTN